MRRQAGDMVARILAREWIGLGFGLLVAVLGIACYGLSRPLAVTLLMLAVLMCVGSIIHLLRLAAMRRRYPPTGRLVDVGGQKMHVLAEGEATDHFPVVWLTGGHASALTMDHVHRAMRTVTRSIQIDRFGTGWSDTGPFPRTTVGEVEEVLAALDAAGETGPFVFAGYSFGGLLVANIARRHPQRVARLVLLDPTPLETLVFGPRLGAIKDMRRDALFTALARLFGFNIDFQQRRFERNAAHQNLTKHFEQTLGSALETLKEVEISAGARLAEWSIYRELLGPHIASCGWETVVYDGDLGDMSVWLVAPGTSDEVADTPEVASAGAETARMFRFFQRSRERYMATSTNSRRVLAPAGASHQFVYEHPDFVIATMREAVRRDL